ncbi:MAG: hypothetical protein AAGH64_01850, partial [Planctomycetota bacterium]
GSGELIASLDDKVLERHVPDGVRDAIARTAASGVVPPVWAAPIVAYARARAEREARAQRARLVRSGRRHEDAIAFAGTSD